MANPSLFDLELHDAQRLLRAGRLDDAAERFRRHLRSENAEPVAGFAAALRKSIPP